MEGRFGRAHCLAGQDAPAVCMFDTGVNRGHALIEPALAPDDMHTLNEDWGVDDQDQPAMAPRWRAWLCTVT